MLLLALLRLHLHHVLHLHRRARLLLLLTLGLGHNLLGLQGVRGRVHRRLVGRRRSGALAVGRRRLRLGDARRGEWRRVRGSGGGGRGGDVPRVRARVLETLVLAAGQKRETDRTMITRMLIVVPYTDQIASVTCPRERS